MGLVFFFFISCFAVPLLLRQRFCPLRIEGMSSFPLLAVCVIKGQPLAHQPG